MHCYNKDHSWYNMIANTRMYALATTMTNHSIGIGPIFLYFMPFIFGRIIISIFAPPFESILPCSIRRHSR